MKTELTLLRSSSTRLEIMIYLIAESTSVERRPGLLQRCQDYPDDFEYLREERHEQRILILAEERADCSQPEI
eukprot:20536-Heterococcus_DN1.PRE.2